jgi:hypothetical protein
VALGIATDRKKQSSVIMLYFPQLTTGAIAQFPIERRAIRRTVVNRLPDGTLVKLDDPRSAGIAWTLHYDGLSDAERLAIEALFCEAEGRLHSFLFLDPASNLLRWSEDLTAAVWQTGGALQVANGVIDPNKTERAIRIVNAAQAPQSIVQSVNVPGWLRYCFSIWVRSSARTPVSLSLLNADGEITSEHFAADEWRLVSCSSELAGSAEDVSCRFAVDAAAAVDVYGFQLSAQSNPDTYRRTYSASGVYADSHFLDDELKFTANGIDDHAVTVRVFSRVES